MKCCKCGNKMIISECLIHAGKSWHERDCIKFKCEWCKIEYNVETTNIFIIFLLKKDNKILNKLALYLSKDYEYTNWCVIERPWRL